MTQEIWMTYDGRIVSLDSVSHQHLSNCYWFLKIFYGYTNQVQGNLLDKINTKFEGVILPYKPKIDFIETY